MKYFVFVSTLLLIFISGCQSDEGKSVDGQKQISFTLTLAGENENWKVTDEISGEYFNIEQLYERNTRFKNYA
jgi:hypothetical protein